MKLSKNTSRRHLLLINWACQHKTSGAFEEKDNRIPELGLVSKYTVVQYKPPKITCNESDVDNILNQELGQEKELKVI